MHRLSLLKTTTPIPDLPGGPSKANPVANSYTAYPSPCWWGNHLFKEHLKSSGALPSFIGLI